MKINRPSGITNPAAKRTGRSSSAGSGSFRVPASSGGADTPVSGSSGLSGATPLAGVDALLVLQEVDSAGTGHKPNDRKQQERGNEILDRLDEIRHGFLFGQIPQSQLERLIRLTKSDRGSVTDPRLASILDEIELRAAVELAKLKQYN